MKARPAVLLAGLCFAAIVAACSKESNDNGSKTEIRILDSAFTQSWEVTEDKGTVYRIEVVSPVGADTIRNVIPPEPISVGDSVVIGLIQASEDSSAPERQIFVLHLRDHRVDTKPLPADVWESYEDVLVSPDGRFLAYVGSDTTPTNPGTYAVVRDLNSGEVVVKGPGGGGCDCDDDLNHARWFAPDSFEIAVSHANSNGAWQRVSGRASTRTIHVDTLSDEPDWH